MALPTNLISWREFVSRTATRPEQLSAKDLAALDGSAREEYDQQRVEWLNADVVLETPDVHELRRLWAVLRAQTFTQSATSPRTLAVSGQAMLGKTTTAMWIARDHERRVRRQTGSDVDPSFQPSLYVITPAATTPKMLMRAFCEALLLPWTGREDAQVLTERVVRVIRAMRTSLVVLDEIQNVHSNRQAGAEAAGVLKQFIDRFDAAFILAGTNLDRAPVFRGQAGEQLANRTMLYHMRGFSYRTADQRAQWGEVVASFNDLLPLARQNQDSLQSLAPMLFDVTGGSIGLLRELLRPASIDAIITGTERVDRGAIERQVALHLSQNHSTDVGIETENEVRWASA